MNMVNADTRDDRLMPDELMSYPMPYDQRDGDQSGQENEVSETALAEPAHRVNEIDPRVRTELATSLHFILSQYLRPSTLRRLIGPRDAMIGRVMLGRNMQGEIDDDLLARVLAQAVVEHIRQSGFVVQHRHIQADNQLLDDNAVYL